MLPLRAPSASVVIRNASPCKVLFRPILFFGLISFRQTESHNCVFKKLQSPLPVCGLCGSQCPDAGSVSGCLGLDAVA